MQLCVTVSIKGSYLDFPYFYLLDITIYDEAQYPCKFFGLVRKYLVFHESDVKSYVFQFRTIVYLLRRKAQFVCLAIKEAGVGLGNPILFFRWMVL